MSEIQQMAPISLTAGAIDALRRIKNELKKENNVKI